MTSFEKNREPLSICTLIWFLFLFLNNTKHTLGSGLWNERRRIGIARNSHVSAFPTPKFPFPPKNLEYMWEKDWILQGTYLYACYLYVILRSVPYIPATIQGKWCLRLESCNGWNSIPCRQFSSWALNAVQRVSLRPQHSGERHAFLSMSSSKIWSRSVQLRILGTRGRFIVCYTKTKAKIKCTSTRALWDIYLYVYIVMQKWS